MGAVGLGVALLAVTATAEPTPRADATALFRDAALLPVYENGQMVGLGVSRLRLGGTLHHLGLVDHDVILAVDGEPIEDQAGLRRALHAIHAAEALTLHVRGSDGRQRMIRATRTADRLTVSPAFLDAPREEPTRDEFADDDLDEPGSPDLRGAADWIVLAPFYEGGALRGARVREGGSDQPGTRPGDTILEANGRPIDGLEALEALDALLASPGRVELLFRDASGVEALSTLTID